MSQKNIIISFIILLIVGFIFWLPEPVDKSASKSNSGDQNTENKISLINQITLFDGETWQENIDVVFSEGYILDVGKDLSRKYSDVTLIDGNGKYLIPGLIDGHTHAWGNALKDAVRFGVTTELDMFTNNAFAIQQRKQRERHLENIQQADLFSAGTLITSADGHGTEYGFEIPTINDSTEATSFIKARVDEGSDYIKIVYNSTNRYMPSINRETLNAVVQSAQQQGKLAVVHISDYESALHAIEAGANGLVHSFMDKAEMSYLTGLMAKNNQFVIPTLSILASMTGQDFTQQLIADFEQQGVDVKAQKIQLAERVGKQPRDQVFTQAKLNIGNFLKAGVVIIAGTDAPNAGTAHGISLHGELELLVQSGLTPTQALAAATANPAKAFKLDGRGFIKQGKKADLVLLNKDPRDNIRNSREINSVYKNGFLISQEKEQLVSKAINVATELGSFDQDLKSSLSSPNFYSEWVVTTDEMFKGQSTATLKRIDSVEDPYVQIIGQINKQFSFPWAGIYLVMSEDNETGFNLSSMSSIDFKVKGVAGDYRLLLFSTKQPMRPIELGFTVSQDWNEINLQLKQVPQVLLESITGLAIVAGASQSEFELNIDDVWLR